MKNTSREAFIKFKPKREIHHKIILKVMNSFSKDLTGQDISDYCELGYHAVMKRMSELVKLKKVETTDTDLIQGKKRYRLINIHSKRI